MGVLIIFQLNLEKGCECNEERGLGQGTNGMQKCKKVERKMMSKGSEMEN
jgi:hypothetical protein